MHRTTWTTAFFVLASCGGVSSGDGNDGGGSDGAGDSLSVLVVSPDDAASDVEIDAPLEVRFSAPIDEASVTAASFQVRSGGIDVAGTLGTSGDTVTFRPDVQWHIAGLIELTITTDVRSTSGATLAAEVGSSFEIVEGAWQNPALIATTVNGFSTSASNVAGDIVYPFVTSTNDIAVVTFDADTQQFAPAQSVENLIRSFANPSVGITEEGEAIITWGGLINSTPNIIGWSRYDGTTWEPGQIQNSTIRRGPVGLAPDGTAVLGFRESGAVDAGTLSAFLTPAGTAWSTPVGLQTESTLWGFRTSGAGVQAIIEDTVEGGAISRQFSPGNNSFGPASIIDPDGDVNFINYKTTGGGDTAFSWMRDNVAVHFSRYDAASGNWTSAKLGDGTGGSQVCVNEAGRRVGVFRAGQTMLARLGEAGADFGLPESLGTMAGVEFADCFIDASGNAHALYGGFGSEPTRWSRLRPTGGWTTLIALASPSGAVRGMSADRFGNVTIIYVEGTQAFALRYR